LLLTGRPPNDLEALNGSARLNSKVDNDLDSPIVSTLQRRPADRPQELAPFFNGIVKAPARIGRKPSAEVVAAWVKAGIRGERKTQQVLRVVPKVVAYDEAPDLIDDSEEGWVEPVKFDG
jgi:hypothetical protein